MFPSPLSRAWGAPRKEDTVQPIRPPDLAAIRAARERLNGVAVRTPLVRLDATGLAEPSATQAARLETFPAPVFENPPRSVNLAPPPMIAAGHRRAC